MTHNLRRHRALNAYIDSLLEHSQERSVDRWLRSRSAFRRWQALHIAKLKVLMR